jgi:hypothetical protein
MVVLLAYGTVPHGPDMGFHVEPIYWLIRFWKNVWELTIFEPVTSGMEKQLGRARLANPPSY